MAIAEESPIHEEHGKWYFWFESWDLREGPFDTEEEAKEALEEYHRDTLEGAT